MALLEFQKAVPPCRDLSTSGKCAALAAAPEPQWLHWSSAVPVIFPYADVLRVTGGKAMELLSAPAKRGTTAKLSLPSHRLERDPGDSRLLLKDGAPCVTWLGLLAAGLTPQSRSTDRAASSLNPPQRTHEPLCLSVCKLFFCFAGFTEHSFISCDCAIYGGVNIAGGLFRKANDLDFFSI